MLRTALCAGVIVALACSASGAAERPLAHWDFETGDLGRWQVAWGDLGPQPTDAGDDRWGGDFGKQGAWFVGTGELPGGGFSEALTGEVWSPVFVIHALGRI